MLWYLSSSIFMSALFLMAYVYYLKKGQFSDEEDTKYQIFHEEDS